MTDWTRYRKCQVCNAAMGLPCLTRSGRVVAGQPDGVVTTLPTPHRSRPLRTSAR